MGIDNKIWNKISRGLGSKEIKWIQILSIDSCLVKLILWGFLALNISNYDIY